MTVTRTRLLLLALAAISVACSDASNSPTTAPTDPAFAKAKAPTPTGTPAERAAQLAKGINEHLAAKGSKLRLTEAHFFTVGKGVPEFRSHNFDARWPHRDLTYYIDASDFTADAPAPAIATRMTGNYRSTGRPAARHAWKPPSRSVARLIPSSCNVAAARLDW